jgi:hypothetical protein
VKAAHPIFVFSPGRRVLPIGLSLLALLSLGVQPGLAHQSSPSSEGETAIHLEKDDLGKDIFKVVGWPRVEDARSQVRNLTKTDWQQILAVYVELDSNLDASQMPPMVGTYRIEASELIFQPRFPLEPGLDYRATFDPTWPPKADRVPTHMTATFRLPKLDATPSTHLLQIYPSIDVLPENQLKFYLHFSAPMSRGEAYRRIGLLDEDGQPVVLPFLELDEELWDREGRRLTLLFDPGRIKRGVRPLEEVGPAIEEGKSYTLVIDRNWRDAEGKPLTEGYEKSFRVGAPDRKSPGISSWHLVPPHQGSTEPLIVDFPEPLDQALLLHLLEVTDSDGNTIVGSIGIDRRETRWQFTPQQPWPAGDYLLEVGTTLEDLAGNRVNRLFEVDVFERVEEQVTRETVSLPFKVQ